MIVYGVAVNLTVLTWASVYSWGNQLGVEWLDRILMVEVLTVSPEGRKMDNGGSSGSLAEA